METQKSFSREEAEKDFGGRLFFLAAIFPFQTKKPALAWLLRQTFSTGWGGTQLGAACFCTSKGRKSPIFVSVKQGQWKRWNSYRFCAVPLWNSELLRGEHHSLGRVYICGRAKKSHKTAKSIGGYFDAEYVRHCGNWKSACIRRKVTF